MAPPSSSSDDARLDTLLRAGGLAEPSPWFAARTVARLRHERSRSWFRMGFGLSFARAALLLAAVGFSLAGWELKTHHDRQQLTFAALEAVAQGVEPSLGEEEEVLF
ncbi:MAG: hypothetical protein PW734_12695 [Verrucomicrobium sp.]|nr:hypothetical protein [Verrucomicrobium sp.]